MTSLTWLLASLLLVAGCVDTHLRAGFACVIGACWENAPVDGGTVFIERRPAR